MQIFQKHLDLKMLRWKLKNKLMKCDKKSIWKQIKTWFCGKDNSEGVIILTKTFFVMLF